MSITATAGDAFEATISGLATGLVGTLGVRVEDGQGDTVTARTVGGIVESPAGSGVYTATLTAPSIAGQYVVVWDTGGSSARFAAEDLIVDSSIAASDLPEMSARMVAFTRRLVAIRAAMLVEQSYEPEQSSDDASAYARLKEMYDSGLATLFDALGDQGDGPTMRIGTIAVTSPTASAYRDVYGIDLDTDFVD